MKVRVRVLAQKDLLDGYYFYEKKSSGLGADFLTSLKSEIDSLASFGGMHPIVHGSHRAMAKRFPYAIFYDVQSGEVHVWAVAHWRRGPNWFSNRLKER